MDILFSWDFLKKITINNLASVLKEDKICKAKKASCAKRLKGIEE